MLDGAVAPPEPEIALSDASTRPHGAIYLNDRWRVFLTDPLQWVLQRRRGSGWRDRSFCRQRAILLRCVREYCGEVDAAALAKVERLPEWHA